MDTNEDPEVIPWRTDEGTLIERIAKIKRELRKLFEEVWYDRDFRIAILLIWIACGIFAIISAVLG